MSTRKGTSRPRGTGRYRYLAFNKPYGVLSQFTGAPGQRTLSEFELPTNVYAAGRLDADSEGLLILTDDGPLIQRLLSPRFGHPRTYWAQVEGSPGLAALQALRSGPRLPDGRCRPCEVRLPDPQPDVKPRIPPIRFRKLIPTTWLEIILREGRNRQVRRMTAAVGHPTLRLIRIAIGAVHLDDIPPGKWRVIDPEMIQSLGASVRSRDGGQ